MPCFFNGLRCVDSAGNNLRQNRRAPIGPSFTRSALGEVAGVLPADLNLCISRYPSL